MRTNIEQDGKPSSKKNTNATLSLSLICSAIAALTLLTACASTPKTTLLLGATKAQFVVAQNNPRVSTYAQLEMKQANDALVLAEESANRRDSDEQIDALAYLAKQKVATAQELGDKRAAEVQIKNAGQQRDQLRLDQRTNEANQAILVAEQAKNAASNAQQVSDNAQRESAEAKGSAQDARRDTEVAQAQTADAKRIADEALAKNQKLEAQLAELSAKKTDRGVVITFGDVLFHTDQARLSSAGMESAKKLANVMQQNPQRSVLVEGFTDSTGSNQHNQELSERRSSAVKTALENLGIARERIAVRGYGESYPVASNATAEDRRLNRRVEIVLSDDTGKVIPR